jgi:hypothetical protein
VTYEEAVAAEATIQGRAHAGAGRNEFEEELVLAVLLADGQTTAEMDRPELECRVEFGAGLAVGDLGPETLIRSANSHIAERDQVVVHSFEMREFDSILDLIGIVGPADL